MPKRLKYSEFRAPTFSFRVAPVPHVSLFALAIDERRRSAHGGINHFRHRGTDNPTMAILSFMAAKTAKEQAHEVVLELGTKPSRWRKQVWPINIISVNLAPLKELLAPVVAVGLWEGGGQAKAVAMGRK